MSLTRTFAINRSAIEGFAEQLEPAMGVMDDLAELGPAVVKPVREGAKRARMTVADELSMTDSRLAAIEAGEVPKVEEAYALLAWVLTATDDDGQPIPVSTSRKRPATDEAKVIPINDDPDEDDDDWA